MANKHIFLQTIVSDTNHSKRFETLMNRTMKERSGEIWVRAGWEVHYPREFQTIP